MCIFLKQSLRGMGVGIYYFLCFTPTPIRTYPYRCEWEPSHTNNMAKNQGEGSKVPSMLQRHWEFLGGLLGQPTSFVTDFPRNFENLSHTISSKNVSTSRSEDLMQTCLIPSPQLASVFHSVYTIIPELLSSPEQKKVLLVVAPRLNLLQVFGIYILQEITWPWDTISMQTLKWVMSAHHLLGTIEACFSLFLCT